MTAAQMAQFHNSNVTRGKRKASPSDFNPFHTRPTVKVGVDWLKQFVPTKGKDA